MSNNHLLILLNKHFSWLRTFTTNASACFFTILVMVKLEFNGGRIIHVHHNIHLAEKEMCVANSKYGVL